MKDWNLRRATNEDRIAIMLLVAESLAEFGVRPDPATSEADLADLEATYDASGGIFLIAEREGLVGTGIRKMYVRADLRGQGIGSAILKRLIEETKARGRARIVLETMTPMVAAQAMYERYGFRPVEGDAESPRCDRLYALELE
jgi:putative acetyltransferase